jgi:nucleotide-binding universal stress UspA family protein
MKSRKTILVPCDFTPITYCAIDHAVNYARILDTDIALAHVINKDEEVINAAKRIEALAEEVNQKYQVKPSTYIREGSIFTSINEISTEIESEMVVMGTHGIKGWQKITGSWALKVIVSSKVPYIVVQEPPGNTLIDKIVFPVDFRKETKEKIGWASFIANRFSAKVHILKPNANDRGFKRSIESNMNFTQKYFDMKEVPYEIHQAEGISGFADETINFAREISAELILIMTTKNISLPDYMLGANEQYVIANSAKIPVMCLNPRPRRVGGFSATGN